VCDENCTTRSHCFLTWPCVCILHPIPHSWRRTKAFFSKKKHCTQIMWIHDCFSACCWARFVKTAVGHVIWQWDESPHLCEQQNVLTKPVTFNIRLRLFISRHNKGVFDSVLEFAVDSMQELGKSIHSLEAFRNPHSQRK